LAYNEHHVYFLSLEDFTFLIGLIWQMRAEMRQGKLSNQSRDFRNLTDSNTIQSQNVNYEKRLGAFFESSEIFAAFRGWHEDFIQTMIVERCNTNFIRTRMNVGTFGISLLNGPMLPFEQFLISTALSRIPALT
jgi:hypothetical protein